MRRLGVRFPILQRAALPSGLITLAIAIGFQSTPTIATAATAAYWRHEEGPAGSNVSTNLDSVLDSSGNGNHMRTFNATTAATYSTVVSPLPLRSGLPNTLSLDFGPGGDDAGLNDDNYTENKLIATQLMTAMTVELAFRMDTIGGFQGLFTKDGKPLGDAPGEDDSPLPPLAIKVRGDSFPNAIPNQLQVEWIDGDGTLASDIHSLTSGETIVANQWYHVAFTLSATDAQLYIAGETGPYVLKDSLAGQDFAGDAGNVLVFEPDGFDIGRGFYNNGVTDWSDAKIDEVRVSDAVLTPDQFLFVTAAANNADFDGNGTVDGRDFLIWQRGQSGAGGHSAGDANGDNLVNADDLTIWKSQFGSSAVSAVPEPAAAALLLLGMSAAVAFGRRRS